MIVGLGIDIVELDRIERIVDRFGTRFTDRILTLREQGDMPRNAVPFLAGRFAAKEAASKALGTGLALGVSFHSLEVVATAEGKPELRLHAAARDLARSMGVVSAHLSITHGRDAAVAVVVLEKEG
ncbi:MAG: holo-[acyl-carrier-protein] synthase [Desulfovibrionales bacterium]